jgi:hypothetical protein
MAVFIDGVVDMAPFINGVVDMIVFSINDLIAGCMKYLCKIICYEMSRL